MNLALLRSNSISNSFAGMNYVNLSLSQKAQAAIFFVAVSLIIKNEQRLENGT